MRPLVLLLLFVFLVFLIFLGLIVRNRNSELFDNQTGQTEWNFIGANVRVDCSNPQNISVKSLDECKKQCYSDSSCNIINYDVRDEKSCFLETCANPRQFDFQFFPQPYPGSEVWALSKDTSLKPKTEPKTEPKTDSGLSPINNYKNCPDMSKYIRIDEIPCWNCSLP